MTKQRDAGEYSRSLSGQLSAAGPEELSAAAADELLAISGMSAQEVERLALQAYRRHGYQVTPLGASGAGLLLTKDAQRLLMQCKYWKTRKIVETPVRELYGMMAEHDANAGMLISSGNFTLEASRFAGYGRIQLIDGPRLLALLHEGNAADPSTGPAARTNAAVR
jgi:restriction system protein